jgi:hypothetical protein
MAAATSASEWFAAIFAVSTPAAWQDEQVGEIGAPSGLERLPLG